MLVYTSLDYVIITLTKAAADLGKEFKEINPLSVWFEKDRNLILEEKLNLNVSEFWEAFRKYDTPESRIKNTKPYYDTKIVLDSLRKKGYRTAVLTAAQNKIAKAEIGLIGEEYFDAVLVAQECNGIMPKPHPDGIEKCLGLLDLGKEEVVFVDNSDEDIETAENAGVLDVLIDREEYKFPNLKPSHKITSLYELGKTLSKQLSLMRRNVYKRG